MLEIYPKGPNPSPILFDPHLEILDTGMISEEWLLIE